MIRKPLRVFIYNNNLDLKKIKFKLDMAKNLYTNNKFLNLINPLIDLECGEEKYYYMKNIENDLVYIIVRLDYIDDVYFDGEYTFFLLIPCIKIGDKKYKLCFYDYVIVPGSFLVDYDNIFIYYRFKHFEILIENDKTEYENRNDILQKLKDIDFHYDLKLDGEKRILKKIEKDFVNVYNIYFFYFDDL